MNRNIFSELVGTCEGKSELFAGVAISVTVIALLYVTFLFALFRIHNDALYLIISSSFIVCALLVHMYRWYIIAKEEQRVP